MLRDRVISLVVFWLTFLVLIISVCPQSAGAEQTPWTYPQVDWKPFTALPVLDNPSGYWSIQERTSANGIPKFFAQSIHSANRFFTADPGTTPNFAETTTTLPYWNATTTAMAAM